MSLAAFVAVALMSLMAAVSPGPAVLMAARTGVAEGMRAGVFVALGIGVGAVVWAAAALLGLAVLFEIAPAALWTLRLVGGAYLVWLAVKLWRSADMPLSEAAVAPRSPFAAFRRGLGTQLANPKPAVMFSAIFLGTVPETAGWPIRLALLLVVFLNETLWNIIVARIFSLGPSRRAYLGLKGWIDRAFGGALALLGVKIASS